MGLPDNQPAYPPPDREEHVEVVNQAQGYEQRRVVRDRSAEQRLLVERVTQIIWLLFGFLEALIAIRIILKLIGANPAAVFSQVIYGVTEVFLWPFSGIIANPGVNQFQLEISSIIGMIVYGLIAWGLVRLIWILFYRPETGEVTTYHQERY